ncbi:MAG: DUF192 domain-containing protein [Candidatus Magasanikbacteria bacterium]|nr:DUF192 domain-containing protein [Candidatus Magasanikbacteria bacterium]
MTIAETFWQRWRGLIGSGPLASEAAFFIPDCRRVHTWFMRAPIDVAFLDAGGTVVALFERLLPWRVTPRVPGASHCLELPAHGIRQHRLAVGDVLPLSLFWQLPLNLFLTH